MFDYRTFSANEALGWIFDFNSFEQKEKKILKEIFANDFAYLMSFVVLTRLKVNANYMATRYFFLNIIFGKITPILHFLYFSKKKKKKKKRHFCSAIRVNDK